MFFFFFFRRKSGKRADKEGGEGDRRIKGRRHEGLDGRAAAKQFSWGLQIGNWTINDLGRVSAYLCTCYFTDSTGACLPQGGAHISAPFHHLTDKIDL